MNNQNQSNQSAAQQQTAAQAQQTTTQVQQTTALVPPTVISSQQLPAAQTQTNTPTRQLDQRAVKKEAKRIKRALRDKVRGDISAANCSSPIEEYAVAKKTIDDYFAAHAAQFQDAVLVRLRSILYNPDNLNESGKSLFGLLTLDIFAVKFFESIIDFRFTEKMPPIWQFVFSMITSVGLGVVILLLLLFLYKMPNMLERYSDRIDAYKLEALDKIIEQREQQREQELNNPHP